MEQSEPSLVDVDVETPLHPNFSALGLASGLLPALEKQGVSVPTAIQSVGIPVILDSKSVYLQSETGSGKTLAYLLPLFTRIDAALPAVQAVIVAPTHELAIQIHHQCTDLAQQSGIALRSLLLIGGTPKDRQIEKLKKKPHIVVGSPGRILELIKAGKLKAHKILSIVLDEADRVLMDEHGPDVLGIIKAAPGSRQLIFASATQRHESREIIEKLAPQLVMLNPSPDLINQNIEHFYIVCEEREKPDVLRSVLHAFKAERAMIFVHRNETAEKITDKLLHHKFPSADLHGANYKEDRKRAMDGFRSGKIKALISSDVGARGLDVKGVTHVINFDVPTESKAYLHRVGRTARAGATGIAISLLTDSQGRLVRRFEEELGIAMREFCMRHGEVMEVKREQ